jgi:hypothetical protein
MHLTRSNIILIIVAAITFLSAVYYYGFYNKDTGSAVVPVGPASDAQLDFVNLAGQVDSITFDTSLLTDPRFTRLVDIRTTIIPEVTGRHDPFAAIPGTVVPTK